jgi:hypothetical protein
MVGHEEGHKETKQFMLHSVPDRLGLKNTKQQDIWTVLEREPKQLVSFFKVTRLCQV